MQPGVKKKTSASKQNGESHLLISYPDGIMFGKVQKPQVCFQLLKWGWIHKDMANHPTPAIRSNDCSAGQYNCQGMRLFFHDSKSTAHSCVHIHRKRKMLGGISNRQILSKLSCLRTIMQCSLQTV